LESCPFPLPALPHVITNVPQAIVVVVEVVVVVVVVVGGSVVVVVVEVVVVVVVVGSVVVVVVVLVVVVVGGAVVVVVGGLALSYAGTQSSETFFVTSVLAPKFRLFVRIVVGAGLLVLTA
jgi:hypothetical protein